MRDIRKLSVRPDEPMRNAINRIDEGRSGIALVLDETDRLLGTITDGDVRRAILARFDMDVSAGAFLEVKRTLAPYSPPVTAPHGSDLESLLALMIRTGVRQIPLVDRQGRVMDLAVVEDMLTIARPPVRAVIMAGGYGSRLLPLTEELPKPMLPVGGRPLLEHIIRRLYDAGIHRINVSTHYKSEKIVEHFGDGHAFGIELHYINEDRPLGTAGALGLMSVPTETQLVINGDILTRVDFRAMLEFHQEHNADMTVGVRQYDMEVPYGVIDCDGPRIVRLNEKPAMKLLVNAGVYLLEPSVYEYIPKGQRFNMTDLVQWLLDARRRLIGFPIREYWADVGRHSEYARAIEDIENGQVGT